MKSRNDRSASGAVLRLRPAGQQGLTLIELLVAMVVSLVVVMAAVAALTVARRGFTTVDAASQIRDNGRFVQDLINRLGVQVGFQDVRYVTLPISNEATVDQDPPPGIFGFNNATPSTSDPLNTGVPRSGTNGSDVLVLRYQAVETFPGSGVTDKSMIDCDGGVVSAVPTSRADRSYSVIHLSTDSNGGSSLMCTTVNRTGPGYGEPQPIVGGVEAFQVLYGVDGVTAGTAPTAGAADPVRPDSYLRADQLTVTGDAVATRANWRRVRSIRIGMVLQGPPNSAQVAESTTDYYPFGKAKTASGGDGSGMASANDVGTIYRAPNDGRLRQTLSFTVHLRNFQPTFDERGKSPL